MKSLSHHTAFLATAISCLIFLAGCAAGDAGWEELKSPAVEAQAEPYFGLDFPGFEVTRFAPTIFRDEHHAPPIFSPDGREVYWSLMDEPRGVRTMKIENGAWTDPAPAPFDTRRQGDSPFITSDGQLLLYLAWNAAGKETIRIVEREDGGWGVPRELPDEVNQIGAHWQASMADNGNLYFSHERKLYFSSYENGSYQQAVELHVVDSPGDGYIGSPFIAPDESYLIFDIAEPTYADLYISFRSEDGEWGDPIAMEALNSNAHDLYANVSPDGRFIIFLSGRSGILLPYWVDAGIIDEIREEAGF